MAFTVRQVIDGALRLIGVAAPGEPMTAEDQQTALDALNMLLSSWSAERLAVPVIRMRSFTLTPGVGSYTIGQHDGQAPQTGAFDAPRPLRVVQAFTRASGVDEPLRIISQHEYNDLGLKSVDGEPSALYYDAGFPLGTIYLNPRPQSARELHIAAWEPMGAVDNAADDLSLPAEYAHALKFNLSVVAAPEYGREPSAFLVGEALRSKRVAQQLRAQPLPPAQFDFYAPGRTVDRNFIRRGW